MMTFLSVPPASMLKAACLQLASTFLFFAFNTEALICVHVAVKVLLSFDKFDKVHSIFPLQDGHFPLGMHPVGGGGGDTVWLGSLGRDG